MNLVRWILISYIYLKIGNRTFPVMYRNMQLTFEKIKLDHKCKMLPFPFPQKLPGNISHLPEF